MSQIDRRDTRYVNTHIARGSKNLVSNHERVLLFVAYSFSNICACNRIVNKLDYVLQYGHAIWVCNYTVTSVKIKHEEKNRLNYFVTKREYKVWMRHWKIICNMKNANLLPSGR